MAYMRSTGQEAGKINVHKTKRSITERRKRKKERKKRGERGRERQEAKKNEKNMGCKKSKANLWISYGKERLSVSLNETLPETQIFTWNSGTETSLRIST